MDKMIVAKKVLQGAIAGALASAAVLQPDDLKELSKVAITAILVGLLKGGYNAWKHRNDGE